MVLVLEYCTDLVCDRIATDPRFYRQITYRKEGFVQRIAVALSGTPNCLDIIKTKCLLLIKCTFCDLLLLIQFVST